MKKIAIMQPYLFPYIGYFQLINAVDNFIILDNVQYINRGWINRNKILINGKENLFTFSLKKDSRDKSISERFFSDEFEKEKEKFFSKIYFAYAKAPYYKECKELIEKCMLFDSDNISEFISNSLKKICLYIGINTGFIFASEILNKEYKGEYYILELCKKLNADIYINPIGGQMLYFKENFKKENKKLYFLQTEEIIYPQFSDKFIPWLSIIDVMMFNSKDMIKLLLERYKLV